MTWKELAEEINKMPKEQLDVTVVIVDDGGSVVFVEEIKQNKQGNLYIKGF